MSHFLSPLQFEDDGGLPFTLVQPLGYISDVLKAPLLVPTGFKTDLASIPQILWNILPPLGKYDGAAVLHDFLYQHAPTAPRVTRAVADSVLNEAMEVLGVGRVKRWLIYSGVRIGGQHAWNSDRKAASL